MTLLQPHNIGTHLKGIETSFQVVPLFLKSFHFGGELYHFLEFSQSLKGFRCLKCLTSKTYSESEHFASTWQGPSSPTHGIGHDVHSLSTPECKYIAKRIGSNFFQQNSL
jgi:hypothetical protein